MGSFREAFEKKDREALQKLFDQITLSKKACHSRGK